MRAILILLLAVAGVVKATALDLTRAMVVAPPKITVQQRKALTMLLEEVEKRTGVRWMETNRWPRAGGPVIVVGLEPAVNGWAKKAGVATAEAPSGAEGYRICARTQGENPCVLVLAKDDRGVLFGVGRLLRELRLERGRATLGDGLDISTLPKFPLRGHQLGYRPKCNSYDAWDLPVWEQYFRDLAVFGCNAVELIPPRSDDDADSPHFPRGPMEMMEGMSRVLDEYGLDVWVWYPAMDKDYSDTRTVEAALKEWGEVFRRLKRIDAVFVPGGDPGHTQPKVLLPFLEKQARNLRSFHPRAQLWVSPQGFTQEWLDEFVALLRTERPRWLTGIVFGPQVRVSLPRLRELVPMNYPIRHYPDITHSRQCQYPVPGWDRALAVTEGRECINPRPEDQAIIFRRTQPGTIGFITYSEGCNDDVNKIVWSGLGWDPDMPVREILRQYSRYFIGERFTDSFAEGLQGLEHNWRGSLAGNVEIERTLACLQQLERDALPAVLKNWRFQQALFRAYFDAYTQRRLKAEEASEGRAMEVLRAARSDGAIASMARAEALLAESSGVEAQALRTRIFQLAEALFQSIGMQLSMDRYRAIGVGRGAMLDTLDLPLNNRVWLAGHFAGIRGLSQEAERLAAIDRIVNWADPGPGGFYDDLGNATAQPRLHPAPDFERDPAAFDLPRVNFADEPFVADARGKLASTRRTSWFDHAEALYDAPLRMNYTGLDPAARYRLRVVYAGDNYVRKLRLVANGTTEIHPWIEKPVPFKPLEFALPAETTRGGQLSLTWTSEPGLGGNGRACQVSEVWILKEPQ